MEGEPPPPRFEAAAASYEEEEEEDTTRADADAVAAEAQACAAACAKVVPEIETLVNAHLHEIQTHVQNQLAPLLERIVRDVGRAERDIAAARALGPELTRLDAFLDQVANMRRLMDQGAQDG